MKNTLGGRMGGRRGNEEREKGVGIMKSITNTSIQPVMKVKDKYPVTQIHMQTLNKILNLPTPLHLKLLCTT